jgi:hypothetical protein
MPWTNENQKLLEAGYLRFADGTLIKWEPPEKPVLSDPLADAMGKMKLIDQKPKTER